MDLLKEVGGLGEEGGRGERQIEGGMGDDTQSAARWLNLHQEELLDQLESGGGVF